jgi:hypothetical protein
MQEAIELYERRLLDPGLTLAEVDAILIRIERLKQSMA